MADEQGQAEEVAEKASKFKQLWKCPKCSNTLTLYISVSQPPTCNNPKSHTTTSVNMVRVEK